MSEIWSDVLVQECCKREGGKGKLKGEGKVDQISHQNSYLGVAVGMTLDCYDKKQSSNLNGKLGPLSLQSKKKNDIGFLICCCWIRLLATASPNCYKWGFIWLFSDVSPLLLKVPYNANFLVDTWHFSHTACCSSTSIHPRSDRSFFFFFFTSSLFNGSEYWTYICQADGLTPGEL